MYQQLLNFAISVLTEARLSFRFIEDPGRLDTEYDLGLRNILFANSEEPAEKSFQILPYASHYLCRITDIWHCEYYLLKLPGLTSDEDSCTFFLTGPFLMHFFSRTDLYELCSQLQIPENLFDFMQQYYTALPVIQDERWLEGMFCSLARQFWPEQEDICLFCCQGGSSGRLAPADTPVPSESTIAYLEKKYASEDKFMQAIRQGNLEEINAMCSQFNLETIKKHISDSIREQKNNLIMLNILSRKAAQYGGVHPVYIDELFNKISFSIESAVTLKKLNLIFRQIPRRYCMLVRTQSLAGYSSLISRAITYINFHFADTDLGLKHIAAHLAVNKSYLSSQFKEETGHTLTAHIAGVRIDNAIYLLNTSSLGITEIADLCGVNDLNYFIRMFKKCTGMTPGKYRETILSSADSYTHSRPGGMEGMVQDG